MTSNIHAALEIGTTRTVLAVAESTPGGRLNVIRHSEIQSTGVRKSQILDISQATQSIRSTLRDCSDVADIGNAILVVSGQHVRTDHHLGTTPVENGKVSANDIDEVIRSASDFKLPNNREPLDVAQGTFDVDSLHNVIDPEGMSGNMLSLDMLHIHADANSINNARTAAGEAHLELRDPVFAAVCAADATLTDVDRKNGTLVLDLGGGCTGYAAYFDGHLAQAGVIGVGGDHVTNDIAQAFQLGHSAAEQMKTHSSCAIIGVNEPESPRIKIESTLPFSTPRTISRKALDTVVNARLRELFQIIREHLEEENIISHLHCGVVLTGGGAAMRGIDALIQRELGLSVRTGRPINIDGLDDVPHPESFAAISGALLYAHRNYDDKSILKKFFGGLFK